MKLSARRRAAVSYAVAFAALVGGGVFVYLDRHELGSALDRLGFGAVLLSGLFAILGTMCIEQVWANALSGLAGPYSKREAAGVFFVTQLGKYLPGSVWPVLAQMEFGKRSGVGRQNTLTANIVMMAVLTVTGLTCGALFLPWSSPDGLASRWWMLLFLIPLVAALHPRAIPAMLDAALRLFHRPPMNARVRTSSLLIAIAWGFATWLMLGTHLLIMTWALGWHGSSAVAAAIGGMALAFAAGFIFLPAPAGAGVREAVIVATFSSQIGSANALAVALTSRLLLIVADVALAAVGAAVVSAAPGSVATSGPGTARTE